VKYKILMGKGDIKTKRGKISNKSYGARRPKKSKAKVVVVKKKKTKGKT
jgi:30S ribosomal protein S31